ncbi:MAG: hypothetical protein ACI9EB_002026 [Pseudomonas sp.]|jgi:hypothetical protein
MRGQPRSIAARMAIVIGSMVSPQVQAVEPRLSRLTAKPAASLRVIEQLSEVALLRVELADGQREIYSLMRNRAHSSVAFISCESLRYQPSLDTLTVYLGYIPVTRTSSSTWQRSKSLRLLALCSRFRHQGVRASNPALGHPSQSSAVLAVLSRFIQLHPRTRTCRSRRAGYE